MVFYYFFVRMMETVIYMLVNALNSSDSIHRKIITVVAKTR